MKLIFKYLKPYILFVLLIVGLTYIQVQTELILPDYMSGIVTNGIQYGGINEDVPKALVESDYKQLLCFVNDKKIMEESYDLIKQGTNAVIDNIEIEFNYDTYLIKDNVDMIKLKEVLEKPMVYGYLLREINLYVYEDNVEEVKLELDKQLIGLEENFGSMSKLFIQSAYTNVGLNTSTIQSNYILHMGMMMLLISLLSVAATVASTFFATRIASKIAAKMRKDVFEKVESFSSAEFSIFETSSLITRTGNDITKVQQLIQMMLRMMLLSPIMGITAVIKVLRYPSISWLLLVVISVIIFVMIFLLIVAVPRFTIIQKLVDKINGIMRESLDGMLVIRAFNSEKIEENKFDDINTEETKIEKYISRCLGMAIPILTFLMNGLTIAITWFASKQIDIDVMTIGDMMAFIQYAMHVVMSFMFVSVTFFMVPRSLVSVKRIDDVLSTPLSILDKEDSKKMPENNGDLVFDNVSFKYPGAEEFVLENISFSAKPGETVALIGSTGSGKSTIVKLIPRLFDVTSGKILYCGQDIRDYKQKDLRNCIGYVPQKAILFTGTIESNIKFGRDVIEDDLKEAIDISQSRNIIDEKTDGLNEQISQGGTNVSGGQKQRLFIARALAKKENIYIFDDSFSALDYETDKKLRKELEKLIEKTKSTVIIVGQRISTIKKADKIIVLDEGKIVGIGKHSELLNSCNVYKEIARSQLSDEELQYA